jgi:hypothetical protein
VVVPAGSRLHAQLRALADTARCVFFAGLPGTGKSLLIHQLAHLAAAAGRTVHLLQWDTARPVFEASPAGRRYPMRDGVTHGVIRHAAGLWVRPAILAWTRRHGEAAHLLVGETPLVGHRFIELARPLDDGAEAILTAPTTRFVIPVPSREVRRDVEAERARRAVAPRHGQEREDAPPSVLQALWRELAGLAVLLGLAAEAEAPYDPELYARVYAHLLRHRPVEVLPVETWLPTAALSVYDFGMARRDLLPTPEEAAAFIRAVERRFPDPAELQRAIDGWYLV